MSERKKLKEEYFGLPGKEIAAAKQQGEVRSSLVSLVQTTNKTVSHLVHCLLTQHRYNGKRQ